METDRRYAGNFRELAETVRGQVRQVQVMLQAMQSIDRDGADVGALLQDRNPWPGIPQQELLERGRRVLRSYLKVRGITDPAEQQEICDMIMEGQPGMLASLYLKDYHGEEDAAAVYRAIMEHYAKHKMDIAIEDVEGLDLGERLDQKQKETFVACWNRLGQMGLSKEHIIAVMANIYAESRFSATNAQERYGYIGLYDNYKYKTDDSVGYGICQWTNPGRKSELLRYANDTNSSVHELETQLNYFQYEMEEGMCRGYWKVFLKKKTVYDATEYFMDVIENPKVNNIEKRMKYAEAVERWYLGIE